MAANGELKRVNEWGPLRGFSNLCSKEHRAWWRTRRWWVNAIIWPLLLCGLTFNMLRVATEMKFDGSAQANALSELVPNVLSVGSVFFDFGTQVIAIGVIILAQGLLVGERRDGVAEWILTKPVARRAYILAKLVTNAFYILLFLAIIPSLLTYAMLSLRMGEPYPLLPYLQALGTMILHSLFYLSLVLMLSAFLNSRAAILGIAFGLLFGGNALASMVKGLVYVSPVALSKVASVLASGQPAPADLPWQALIATAGWCLVFVLAASIRFERSEF